MNESKLTAAEKAIYQKARTLLKKGTDAVAFSDAFFGTQGALRALWKTDADRKRVIESELYRWLQAQAAELRRRDAKTFEQEIEAFSGRLSVVVPKSLHAALRREAKLEGISQSELIRLKLSIPYRLIARLLADPREDDRPRTERSAI